MRGRYELAGVLLDAVGRRKGRPVGWQYARRGYVSLAEQLDGRNRPLPRLDPITGLFADGYVARTWLTAPRPSLALPARV